MGKLEGKTAIVTGASHGIGLGIANVFAKEGAKVVMVARGKAVLNEAQAICDAGYEATGYQCDVTSEEECSKLVAFTVEHYGGLDVLDCNAGICHLVSFAEGDSAWRDSHIDINIKGVWNACKAAMPVMLKAGGGSIVITASVTGDMVADPGEVAYATTKAALIGFTKSLAREVAEKNIRVNCICPGVIQTPLIDGMALASEPEDPAYALSAIAASIPMGRLGTPEECGKLCAFLASDEASYITGAQVVIDGGSTLPETVAFGQ